MTDNPSPNPDPQQFPKQENKPDTEHPDDEIPELPPDADEAERIRLANMIMRQIAHHIKDGEMGTYIKFRADLAIIARIKALKWCLTKSKDFIEAARNCRVSKNDVYAIIKLRLADRIDDIKTDAEIAKRKAEAKGLAYYYPDIKEIIKTYTPPPIGSVPKDEEETGEKEAGEPDNLPGGMVGGSAGIKSNRSLNDYRRENLALSEANRLLTSKLAKAEEAARLAAQSEATIRRDREAAEQRLADAEARIAELERAGQTTDRLRNGRLGLDKLRELETSYHLKGWRGHSVNSLARQLRADFLAHCSQAVRTPPAALLARPPEFWEAQNGVSIEVLVGTPPDNPLGGGGGSSGGGSSSSADGGSLDGDSSGDGGSLDGGSSDGGSSGDGEPLDGGSSGGDDSRAALVQSIAQLLVSHCRVARVYG
jgi:hypothetical protein